MKHVKQGPAECKLASIAMLMDKTLEEVKSLALSMVEESTWMEFMNNRNDSSEKFFDMIESLVLELGGEDDIFETMRIARHGATAAPGTDTLSANELSGKGEITAVLKDTFGDPYAAHSVVYEDGTIYDPSFEEPVPWDIWFLRNKHALYKLTVAPLENSDERLGIDKP